MKHKWIFCILSVLSGITACRNSTVYHTYQPTGTNGWPVNDSLYYSLSPQSVPGVFRLNIGIRHTELYPYKDIWLEIGCKGNETKKDTFHLYLTDQDGHWSNSTTGHLYQCDFDEGMLHLSPQDTTLYIIHLMKDSLLTGLSDVGIRLMLPSGIDTEKHEKQYCKSPQ